MTADDIERPLQGMGGVYGFKTLFFTYKNPMAPQKQNPFSSQSTAPTHCWDWAIVAVYHCQMEAIFPSSLWFCPTQVASLQEGGGAASGVETKSDITGGQDFSKMQGCIQSVVLLHSPEVLQGTGTANTEHMHRSHSQQHAAIQKVWEMGKWLL